jgi:AAA15 family ATPase/GTPase
VVKAILPQSHPKKDNLMLLEFSVKNYLSFKDEVTLSLRGREGVTRHEGDSTFDVAGEPVLKSAVIYGANASGKSNLIKAMQFMQEFVLNSAIGRLSETKIDVNFFKLSPEMLEQTSNFEATFAHEGVYYRYGFELDNSRIHREWLYYAPVADTQEICLFSREFQVIQFHPLFDEVTFFIESLENNHLRLVRETALLSSVIAQFNGKISRSLMRWFENEFNILFSNKNAISRFAEEKLRNIEIQSRTPDLFEDSSKMFEFKEKILEFLKVADTGIDDIGFYEFPEHSARKERRNGFVVTTHKTYSKDGKISSIGWQMDNNESEGTRKLFALSAPIIDALEHGKTLVIDELDSKLHPFMMTFILNLFHSTEKNPKNAQLIFNTHDVNLLSKRFFRRDQIWFTEKNEYGATELYSLADFKDLTDEGINNETFQNDYFQGRYGAVPLTGNLEIFKRDTDDAAKN